MGQLEYILKHQNMVRNNIMKSFGAETSEDSLEKSFEDEVNPFEMEAYKSELTKAELDEFEKAKHQDGDMHPNGKWVWRASANGGKGDWRVAKPGGSKAKTGGGAAASKTTSSSYFSKLSNSLIKKYSKKKESVSLSDIEEFYEDFLRDRSQEPTRKVYANEAKKTYDAIVDNWNKQKTKTASTNTTTSKTKSPDSENTSKKNDPSTIEEAISLVSKTRKKYDSMTDSQLLKELGIKDMKTTGSGVDDSDIKCSIFNKKATLPLIKFCLSLKDANSSLIRIESKQVKKRYKSPVYDDIDYTRSFTEMNVYIEGNLKKLFDKNINSGSSRVLFTENSEDFAGYNIDFPAGLPLKKFEKVISSFK